MCDADLPRLMETNVGDLYIHIISRKQAKSLGMTRYFTGKPCKHGNVAIRYVSNAMCRCKPCSDRHSSCVAKWKKVTGHDDKEYQRDYYQNNSKARKTATKRWRLENRVQAIAGDTRKRHERRQRMCVRIDDDELMLFAMQEARQQCIDMSMRFGVEFHIDHMVPLKAINASGLHCVANIQVIPSSLNYAKSNRMIYTEPFEWTRDLI